MTSIAPTASRLYGAGPSAAPVAGMGLGGQPQDDADKMSKHAPLEAVPSPDAGAAPRAASQAAHLLDDPTFWLVACIGGAALLASVSV